MALVNVKFIVYARLIAQYSNVRNVYTVDGDEISAPVTFNRPILNIPPCIIELPEIDYEYFITSIDEIVASLQFHEDFVKLKDSLNNVDISKIDAPKEISVSDVPLEYVTFDNNKINRHIVTNKGIYDVNEEGDIEDPHDDVGEDQDMSIENVCSYVKPNFTFKKSVWSTTIDLLEFGFTRKKPQHTATESDRRMARPIKDILLSIFNRK